MTQKEKTRTRKNGWKTADDILRTQTLPHIIWRVLGGILKHHWDGSTQATRQLTSDLKRSWVSEHKARSCRPDFKIQMKHKCAMTQNYQRWLNRGNCNFSKWLELLTIKMLMEGFFRLFKFKLVQSSFMNISHPRFLALYITSICYRTQHSL